MLCDRDAQSLIVQTPAKVNLFLEVLGRRPDGFHELETLMVAVGLYDTLSITPTRSTDITLKIISAGAIRQPNDDQPIENQRIEVPTGRENLVLRAAELLREKTGVFAGARLDLHKRIPAAAGLAGGSSDAAAALVGLNRVWKLGLSAEDLHELAGQLGSDVPFFLAGSAAICRGRGEILEPVSLPVRLYFVIVRPPTGLATAQVFQHCRPAKSRKSVEELISTLASGNPGAIARHLHNRLFKPAFELNEDVRKLRKTFDKLPVLGHMMSGSGTSYFGICAQRKHARTVAARLKATRIGHVFTVASRP